MSLDLYHFHHLQSLHWVSKKIKRTKKKYLDFSRSFKRSLSKCWCIKREWKLLEIHIPEKSFLQNCKKTFVNIFRYTDLNVMIRDGGKKRRYSTRPLVYKESDESGYLLKPRVIMGSKEMSQWLRTLHYLWWGEIYEEISTMCCGSSLMKIRKYVDIQISLRIADLVWQAYV